MPAAKAVDRGIFCPELLLLKIDNLNNLLLDSVWLLC